MHNEPLLTENLPDAERALLWVMRAWVIGHCRDEDVSERIAAMLAKLGARGSLVHLDRFMAALCRGAMRQIDVNCVCNPKVSHDERLLLDVFALQQQERHDDAYALLRSLVTEGAAIIAGDSAQSLGLSLAAGGTLLPTLLVAPQHGYASPYDRVLH